MHHSCKKRQIIFLCFEMKYVLKTFKNVTETPNVRFNCQ